MAGGERRLTDISYISELLQPVRSWKANMRAGWLAQHNPEPDSNASSQHHVWKAISIWCKSSPFINRKVWNTRWSGYLYHPFPRAVTVLYHDRHLRGGAGP